MGITFFAQNSQLLTFSLLTKEIFFIKSACGKSSSSRFSLSVAWNTITQVKDVTIRFPFYILFYLRFWEILSDINS